MLDAENFFGRWNPFKKSAHAIDDVSAVMSNDGITNDLINGTITRREFLRRSIAAVLLVTGASALASCAPTPDIPSVQPTQTGIDTLVKQPVMAQMPTPIPSPTVTIEYFNQAIKPDARDLFALATKLDPDMTVGLAYLNGEQRDVVARLILDNYIATYENGYAAIQEAAERMGIEIGFAGCADSRVPAPFIFRTTKAGVPYLEYLDAPMGTVLTSNMIGTQPALFKKGVNMSFFVTHQKCVGDPVGCGAGGAIDTIIKEGQAGIDKLAHHGVSSQTIKQLRELIQTGATANPAVWAKAGAKLQAELNYIDHGGVNHLTAWSVFGHADNSFQTMGVVDALGHEWSNLNDFPLLRDFADFFNKPHPIIDKIAAGQTPSAVVFNYSKKRPTGMLFGDSVQQQGYMFKLQANVDGKLLTHEEAFRMMAGGDYDLTHLKNFSNTIVLVADDVDSMRLAKYNLFKYSEGIDKWLNDGGVVIEIIPNAQTGRFAGQMAITQKDVLAGEVALAKGNIVRRTVEMDAALLRQVQDIVKKDSKLTILNQAQASKYGTIAEGLRIGGKLLLGALSVYGNYMLVNDYVEFFKNKVKRKSPFYEVPGERIKYTKKPLLSDAQVEEFSKSQPGVNPYLDRFTITFTKKDLQTAYADASRAFMESGPGGKMEEEPWKSMKFAEKYPIFTIPSVSDDSPRGTRGLHITTEQTHRVLCLVQPQIDAQGHWNFNDRDANQPMQMTNIGTGVNAYTDLPTGSQNPIVFTVTESTPGMVHLWKEKSDGKGNITLDYLYAVPVKKENRLSKMYRQIVEPFAWCYAAVKSGLNVEGLPIAA